MSPTIPDLCVVKFTKVQLMALPEYQRELLLHLGLAVNDLLFYKRVFLATLYCPLESQAATDANGSHALSALLTLAGKTFEAKEVLNKRFLRLSQEIKTEYLSRLSVESKDALDELNKSVGQNNLLAKIRNSFSFHFYNDPWQQLAPMLESLDNAVMLQLYLGDPDGNTVHHYATECITRALVIELQISPDLATTMNVVKDHLVQVIHLLNVFVNGITEDALKQMFGEYPHAELCRLGSKDYKELPEIHFPPFMAKPV